jgi:hypothetical protein
MNKELKLLRTQPANTNTSVPLENVTNLLGIVENVLPSTSTNAEMEDCRKVRKSQRVQTLRENVAVESLILSMPMATKFAQRKKIKQLLKNKRNHKNNLAKNFLLTNFNLITKNNLNI